MPTGSLIDFLGSTAPAGWVLGAGKTIGNASSGATERANDVTKDLFTLLWNSMANAQAAVSGGRGANAAADWAANKTITLPDTRGRTTIALNNLGGSAATTVTSASLDGDKAVLLGGIGGKETHKLILQEMPSHTHNANVWVTGSTYGDGNRYTNTSGTTSSAGGDLPHNNMQPWIATLKIIKL
jgi:microcystin-dependent protein